MRSYRLTLLIYTPFCTILKNLTNVMLTNILCIFFFKKSVLWICYEFKNEKIDKFYIEK